MNKLLPALIIFVTQTGAMIGRVYALPSGWCWPVIWGALLFETILISVLRGHRRMLREGE